jgi:CBS domain-containing protein
MQLSALVGGFVEKVDAATPHRGGPVDAVDEGRVPGRVPGGQGGGISTEHDLTQATAQHAAMDRDVVDDWMSDHPDLAALDWSLDRAADVMVENAIRHVPIVDEGGELVGMVSIKDILWAWRGPTPERMSHPRHPSHHPIPL